MSKAYTLSEVSSHNTEGDAWVVVEGNVYNVTDFLADHPGGKKILLKNCGTDATKKFQRFHGKKTLEKHGSKFKIGPVAEQSKI